MWLRLLGAKASPASGRQVNSSLPRGRGCHEAVSESQVVAIRKEGEAGVTSNAGERIVIVSAADVEAGRAGALPPFHDSREV